MKSRSRIVFAVLEAAFVLMAVYFEPTYGVRGHLWGEPFFEGKSTSWWRHELERWELIDIGAFWLDLGVPNEQFQIVSGDPVRYEFPQDEFPQEPNRYELFAPVYQRESTWLDRLWQGDRDFWRERPGRININGGSFSGPSILAGQADAEPVLRALLDDPSPKVRRMARIGLKLPEEKMP
jgi:hypothetical protein